MIRALIALVVLAGLAWIAMAAADQPGSVTINWMGYRIQASVIVLALGLGVAAFVIWALARVWSWLKGGTPLSPERRALRGSKKGVGEVDAALSALAAGDARKALQLGQAAIKHLDGAGIAYIVSAQAATALGKSELAEDYFEALSKTEQGKFLGLRGRVSEARRLGHVSKALELSEEALKAAPRSDWAIATAFELEAKLGKWVDAEATLRKATAKSIFDAETSARHMGAIRYGEALTARDEDRPADAARLAKAALAIRPDFVPAAILAAQLYKATGKTRRASALLQKIWKRRPHPALAESYAALDPMETAATRLERFKKLVQPVPDHPESRLRLAEAALGAGEFALAEDTLAPLLEGLAPARAGVIMGQVAANQGADAAARGKWAELAQRGTPTPSYTCSVCRTQRQHWSPHCPTCDSFNTFDWDVAADRPALPAQDPALHLVGTAPAALAAPDDITPPSAPQSTSSAAPETIDAVPSTRSDDGPDRGETQAETKQPSAP
ncbi:MAG: tetratricopeptide repeat protein [Pseudomonadota bacterium]